MFNIFLLTTKSDNTNPLITRTSTLSTLEGSVEHMQRQDIN